MDPISKLARSLGIARRRVEDRKSGNGSSAPTGDADGSAAPPRHERLGESSRLELARKIRAVSAQADGGRDACVRIVIEHMLAREFGAAVAQSPSMQQTIRDVQRVMDGDAATRQDFDALIGSLRAETT